MDELDMRLRAMAHREQTVLPPECGKLLDRMEREIRDGTGRRPHRSLARRTVLLAAVLGLLVSCWRLDQGEEPGQFRFIASTGQITDSQITENNGPGVESFLGREVALRVQILDDAATGVMQPVETYAFTVRMNDAIPSREAAWPDGTRVKVTPLMLRVSFRAEVPDFTQPSGRGEDPWMLFPVLADTDEVTGLELRGNWYEFPET